MSTFSGREKLKEFYFKVKVYFVPREVDDSFHVAERIAKTDGFPVQKNREYKKDVFFQFHLGTTKILPAFQKTEKKNLFGVSWQDNLPQYTSGCSHIF